MTDIVPFSPRPPSAVETRLINEAIAIEQESAASAGMLGYMARVLVQATLPHSCKPGCEYKRSNGVLKISIVAPSDIGLPYGSYPRLLLCWLTTEAVRTRSPTLVLGRSLNEFMGALGLTRSGGRWGTVPRLRDQMKRLFGSMLTVMVDESQIGDSPGYFAMEQIKVVSRAQMFWHAKSPSQVTLWDSEVTLTDEFYRQVIDRPVPIDMRAIRALSKSPLALDLYAWLTHRVSYMSRPTTVPWLLLSLQFGAGYPATAQGRADFKRKLAGALKKVELVYPHLRIAETMEGLHLRPSSTHVSRRQLSPEKV